MVDEKWSVEVRPIHIHRSLVELHLTSGRCEQNILHHVRAVLDPRHFWAVMNMKFNFCNLKISKAFTHMLTAVFGYNPAQITERIMCR